MNIFFEIGLIMNKFLLLLLLVITNTYAEVKQSTISVLCLNLWTVPLQRKMVWARAEAAGLELAKRQYDLVLMQEVFTPGVRSTMLYHTGEGFFDRYQRVYTRLNSGLFNLSKFEIVKTAFMPWTTCGGAQCFAKKGIFYLQIKMPNGELVDVFNTHLQAYTWYDNVRRLQLLQTKAYIESKNDGSRPIILAGDFNIDFHTAEYGVFAEIFPNYVDTFEKMNPGVKGYTWDPYVNQWAAEDFLDEGDPERLDYIFVRDGQDYRWEIKSSQITFDKELPWYGSGKNAKYIFASDHFGILTELELTN
jgi:endonuclease/exonuclease/phosphatase family metal-dependent hydrolase